MFRLRNGGFQLKKLRVAVIYGGRSSEHQVSLWSAYSVIKAINQEKYEIIPIGITKDGKWVTGELNLLFGNNAMLMGTEPFQLSVDSSCNKPLEIDVIFPVMHGTTAEDGIIQGLFELAKIPYVGCGVASSVLAFDKALTKSIISTIGLPQAKYIVVHQDNYPDMITKVNREIGYPCFVKPARQGSSVGISKVTSRENLEEAFRIGFQYDSKIIVEEFIQGREIEVSILGNKNPQASLPGEIIPGAEFYDYDAKYIDSSSTLEIPAQLTSDQIAEAQNLALRLYRALDCRGLARVDFFLVKDTGKFYINEINTMPGFTAISMYPKLWEASGLSYPELIEKLISLALENR